MRGAPPFRSSRWPWFPALLVLLCTLAPTATTWADEKLPTAQDIEQRIQALEADKTLDDTTRTAATEILRDALRSLGAIQGHVRRLAEYEARRASAPVELARLQAELTQPLDVRLPSSDPGRSQAELENQLQDARSAETERTKAVEALRDGPANREARIKQIPAELAEARRLLPEVERAVDEPPPNGESKAATEARRTRALLRRESVRAQITALDAEQRALEAEAGLYTARLRVAERARDAAQEIARAWQALAQARREAEGREAQAAAERARREAENADPIARALAERNVELTRVTRRVTEQTKQATLAQQKTKDELDAIDRREADARKRIAAVGLTEAIGLLLRQHRARLPRAAKRSERIAARKSDITELQLLRFEHEDELEELQRVVVAGGAEVPARLRELRENRISYLEASLDATDKGVLALVALDTTERQLLARATAYAAFIDERVLWIRSTDPMWTRGGAGLAGGVAWLTSGESWSGAVAAIGREVYKAPLRYALLLLLYLLLIVASTRVRSAAQQPTVLAAKARSFLPTALRLLADALCAARIPTGLWILGALLERGGASSLQQALGASLVAVAAYLFPLLALRQILAAGGLARAHLGWAQATTDRVRRALPVVIVAGAPLALLVDVFAAAPNDEWNAGPGRMALVGLLAVAAIFLERVLRPSRGVLTPTEMADATWLQRTRGLWYLLGIGVPVILGALALFGYQFTAAALTDRLEQTVALVASLVLLQGLVSRSLVVHRRKIQQAEAAAAQAATLAAAPQPAAATAPGASPTTPPAPSAPSAPPAPPAPPTEEQYVDSATVDAHTRQLLRTLTVLVALLGAWFIWVDVLPALGMLRDVELWSTTEQITRTVVVDGVETPTAVLEVVPVTLADVLQALVVLIFTVLAARNIPGVLEVVLLNRMVAQPSSRYAIATVVRHLIWIIGIAMLLGRLGLAWSKIQWLVAALGVGLGFGLQEIFGNFISGLILLFERRIRLGDIVTVGDVSGQVTRIRVLATTIRSWERKEFIVPNKDLITGRLMNWTLSDDVNRLVVNAGVAYGTDTERARALMVEVARRHPEVVDDPAPFATFEQFGDNSLLLTMRAFITDLSRRWMISTALHEGVAKAFAKAGIEIAFPQRDLHLRTVTPDLFKPPKDAPSSKTP